MISIGYVLMLVFVFFSQSRIFELLAPGIRLPLLLGLGAVFICLLSGTIARGLSTRIGICFLLLTAWFCLGVPFSSYASGSLKFLMDSWMKNLIQFVIITGLIVNRRHLTRALWVVALASSVAAVAAVTIGATMESRLILENSSLDDPNTLGMTMLIGLPLWMTVISDRSRYMTARFAAAMCTIPLLVALPLTGSRGTLVAVMLVIAYMFRRFSMGGKLGLLSLVLIGGLLAGAFVADNMMLRLTSMGSEHDVAANSTDSRIFLLKQGVKLAAYHPIFGVGIGQFAVAENNLAVAQGYTHGSWHTCHDMYLQVMSEAGFPAFVVYMAILWMTWKTLDELESLKPDAHPNAAQIVRYAFWLKITFLSYCACGIFLSSALSPTFMLLTALPIVFARIVRIEIAQLEAEKSASEPTMDVLERAPVPARLGTLGAPVRGLRGQT